MKNQRKLTQHKKIKAPSLSRTSFMILRTGSTVIFLYLLLFLSVILNEAETPTYILARKYAYTLEHIIMSATIIVVGALTEDLVEKDLMSHKDR